MSQPDRIMSDGVDLHITAMDITSEELDQWRQDHQKTCDNLEWLCCSQNPRIKTLPVLPKKLKVLMCAKCSLTTLPDLPDSLSLLSCDENQLETLPKLPPYLRQLNCAVNRLTSLPTLPPTLRVLNCYGNYGLGSLPELPASLEMLQISCDPSKPVSGLADKWKVRNSITTYVRKEEELSNTVNV